MEFSWTRDRTCVSCIGRQMLKRWTIKDVLLTVKKYLEPPALRTVPDTLMFNKYSLNELSIFVVCLSTESLFHYLNSSSNLQAQTLYYNSDTILWFFKCVDKNYIHIQIWSYIIETLFVCLFVCLFVDPLQAFPLANQCENSGCQCSMLVKMVNWSQLLPWNSS